MMETEREKREKLASARKKLNEYKLSRSGTGGRTNASPATPSQPADVPLFYQSINSPGASLNIFNPAAGNNNNVNGPSFIPPVPGQLGERNNGTDPTMHQNINYLPNVAGINQTGNIVQFNPYSSPTPATQYVMESQQLDLPENSNTITTNCIRSTSTVSPAANSPIISQAGEEIALEAPKNLNEEIVSSALDDPQGSKDDVVSSGNAFQVDDVFSSSNTEFSPSAPLIEPITTSTSEHLQQIELTKDTSAYDKPSQSQLTADTCSSIFSEAPQPQPSDVPVARASDCQVDNAQEHVQDASVALYASSLFGTASSELDSIFNFANNSQQTPLPLVSSNHDAPPLLGDNSTLIETNLSPDIHPFTAPVQDEQGKTQGISRPEESTSPGDGSFTEPPVKELANSTYNETTLESETQHSLVKEAPLNEEKPASIVNPDVTTSLQNVQLSYASKEDPDIPRHDELPVFEDNTLQNSSNVSHEAVRQMRSVQEALELQIEELRRENTYLLGRQTELTMRIEESEKLAHEFKLEKDRIREEASTTSQAMRARINALCEENQRIVKNSTDVGVDLRAKYEEKSKQLEEMQQAFVKVSQSKMDFAGRLDHELERVKELQRVLQQKDEEIVSLKTQNGELQEKLKQDHQRDAVIHQLQDQARHYQVQCETLQRELGSLRTKFKHQSEIKVSPQSHTIQNKGASHDCNSGDESHSHNLSTTKDSEDSNSNQTESGTCSTAVWENEKSDENHQHNEQCTNHDHSIVDHQHQHDECKSDHQHHGENHDHSGHHHHEDHQQHNHDHQDHETHDDHHHHNHDSSEVVVARRGPSDEMTEIKKTLHRLQWENSSFRNEIDILAVDAKQKRTYEQKCAALEDENQRLKKEVEQLEHVIIQLQGENDTIGDYITLYQTQKMALKECAKEKDAQLELLAREREMLLHRLAELTTLVKDLRESKSEAGSQCADDHTHMLDSAITPPPNKRQIEGKIRDLLTEISSSSLIENFHPCAVCSGRLMTV